VDAGARGTVLREACCYLHRWERGREEERRDEMSLRWEKGGRGVEIERGALAVSVFVCSLLLLPFYPSPVHLSLSCTLLSLSSTSFSFFLALSPESRSGEEGRSRAVLACGEGGGAEEEGGGTYGSGLKEVDAAFARRK
jgi:hypothetical protein